MQFRTKVYRSILQRMSDYRWHDIDELGQVTSYPEAWLKELGRDPSFEVDSTRMKLRLRPLTAA
jgi:hypothetical protein